MAHIKQVADSNHLALQFRYGETAWLLVQPYFPLAWNIILTLPDILQEFHHLIFVSRQSGPTEYLRTEGSHQSLSPLSVW
jgi:hypothetical protein